MIYVKESYIFNGDIKQNKYPCQNYQEACNLITYLISQGCQSSLHICSLINGKEEYL